MSSFPYAYGKMPNVFDATQSLEMMYPEMNMKDEQLPELGFYDSEILGSPGFDTEINNLFDELELGGAQGSTTQMPQQAGQNQELKRKKGTQKTAPTRIEPTSLGNKMNKFPTAELHDLKHIIYNLLVDWYNGDNQLVKPYSTIINGKYREGFQFNENLSPDKQIPELYARYIRNSRLDLANPDSCIIQDLYKFYMRACLDLLAKYFEKLDKYTFLCDDIVLFVPGESLDQAESRLRTMKSLARKRSAAGNASRGRRKRARRI